MVKIKGPLHSESAHGSLKSRLTFSRRKSGQQARIQRAQQVPTATDLQTQRDFFQEAVEKWNTLTPEEKQQWHDFVKGIL